jgi:cytochrome c oxidase subunit 2
MLKLKKVIVSIFCFSKNTLVGDSAVMYQLGFQDSANLFNLHLLFIILAIVFLVGWLLFSILSNFTELNNSNIAKLTYTIPIETKGIFILLSLASPLFYLLYSLDEIANPELTLKILGHQWYWSSEISDFNSCSNTQNLKYSSYMLTNETLKENNSIGFFRNLETNKRVVLPTNTHLRLLITAVDVLHSWTIPSVGVKVDACSVKWNQATTLIQQLFIFLKECYEILKVNHGFMPTGGLLTMPSIQYHYLIMTNLEFKQAEPASCAISMPASKESEGPYILASSPAGTSVPDDEQSSSEDFVSGILVEWGWPLEGLASEIITEVLNSNSISTAYVNEQNLFLFELTPEVYDVVWDAIARRNRYVQREIEYFLYTGVEWNEEFVIRETYMLEYRFNLERMAELNSYRIDQQDRDEFEISQKEIEVSRLKEEKNNLIKELARLEKELKPTKNLNVEKTEELIPKPGTEEGDKKPPAKKRKK